MNTVETFSLSGMSDAGYENACQKMLWTGVKYMMHSGKLPLSILNDRKEYQNVYGYCEYPENFDECKKLISESVNNDYTGAMMQCITSHMKYIAENGLETWNHDMKKDRVHIFEFNMTTMSLTRQSYRLYNKIKKPKRLKEKAAWRKAVEKARKNGKT